MGGWQRVEKEMALLRDRLDSASFEAEFEQVGHLCRALLSSVARAVDDPEFHVGDGVKRIGPDDTIGILGAYFERELGGRSAGKLKSSAKAALDPANQLLHKRTPDFRFASLCATATLAVVQVVGIVSGEGSLFSPRRALRLEIEHDTRLLRSFWGPGPSPQGGVPGLQSAYRLAGRALPAWRTAVYDGQSARLPSFLTDEEMLRIHDFYAKLRTLTEVLGRITDLNRDSVRREPFNEHVPVLYSGFAQLVDDLLSGNCPLGDCWVSEPPAGG